MATIATTTVLTSEQYPGNRLVSMVNGHSRMMALVKASTADNYVFYRSTDGGSSWASLATVVKINVADIGSIFCDDYEWLYWVYRLNESSTDKILFRRIHTGTGSVSNEQLIGQVGNGGVAGAVYSGLDVVTHYNTSTGWHHIAVATGYNNGGNQGLKMFGGTIDPSGNLFDGNYRFSGTTSWLYAGSGGRIGPTIDKEHTGDGYQSSNASANLWVSFGRTWLRQIKIPWSGDGWTGPTTSATMLSSITAQDSCPSKWDGSRFLMATADPNTASQVQLIERNKANSSNTTRNTPTHPQGTIRTCTLSYDSNTGNCRVWAIGTSTAAIYYVDFIRGTSLWTSWTSTSFTPTDINQYGARISSYQDAKYTLYYGSGSPTMTVSNATYGLSYSPNTPTWVTPTSGAAQDVGVSLPLDWNFSDPDPGDTQSAYAVSRQIGAGALAYWRASDSTWQVAEVQNTSSTTALTLASGWAAATDANYSYKVKVWDANNNPSGYSSAMVVVPSTPVNPAITAPGAGSTDTTNSVTLTWTATEQTKFRVVLVDTTSGSVQVFDSGVITDTSSRSYTPAYVLVNSHSYQLQLWTYNNEGLVSAQQTRNFSVSFTPPATPTLAVIPVPAAGWISVVITNPTPGGGQPAVTNQDLYRRVVGDTSSGIRVATGLANNGAYQDFKTASGVNYQYQVTVFGNNGTSTTSAWTS